MVYEKEDLTKQSCFIEARNVSTSIMKLIQLNIQRDKGIPVDDEIDYEVDDLTAHNLRLKKCILRELKTEERSGMLLEADQYKLPLKERTRRAREFVEGLD